MSTGTEASVSHVRKDVILINQLLFSSESGFSASKIIRHSSGFERKKICALKYQAEVLRKKTHDSRKTTFSICHRFSKLIETSCFTATIETKLFFHMLETARTQPKALYCKKVSKDTWLFQLDVLTPPPPILKNFSLMPKSLKQKEKLLPHNA